MTSFDIMPRVVLVHGLKYSGKSTFAEHLVKHYGYEVVKLASPLKNMLRSLMRDAGVDPELIEKYVEGDLKEIPVPELSGRSSRHMMETLGNDWRRLQAEDFWVDITASKIAQRLAVGARVVVDDIRHHNEFFRFSAFSPMTFVVTRGSKHFETVEKDRPTSERPLPIEMFHAHIKNDHDSKEVYWRDIDRCLKAWGDFRKACIEPLALDEAA